MKVTLLCFEMLLESWNPGKIFFMAPEMKSSWLCYGKIFYWQQLLVMGITSPQYFRQNGN